MRRFFLHLCSAAALPLLSGCGPAHAAGPEGAPEGAAALRSRLAALAGGPVPLDPRLLFPPCPVPHDLSLREGAGRRLLVSCPALGRRLVVPLADEATARPSRPAPVVRRGDRVPVTIEGDGFRVSVEALAEAAGGPGDRIPLRNSRSGRRFSGRVLADGTIRPDAEVPTLP